MQVKIGDLVGPYEILAPLGAGGMGVVYRARDAKLERDVALKILPVELAGNAEALRRFESEARAASSLNHPNIVTIYEVSRSDELAWMAMELVEGDDLRTLVEREPMTMKNTLRIAVRIAEGLAAAHEGNIVHRDLKPDNIMISRDGFVKILDFGLAKQFRFLGSNDVTIPHTHPGAVFGTVGYMSPEQARGKEMDYRSDQFSFGVMLYEMLTRQRPFERESKPETMTAIIRDEPAPPSERNDAVPRELDRIVARCLAKQPRDRYGSTRDLAHDLREVRDALTFPSHRSAGVAPPLRRPGGPAKSRPRIIAAIAVLAVAALGFVGYRMWDRARVAADIDAVAVMPFRDLSGTAEGRMLADGISEMIATRLADVHELRVAAPYDGVPIADGEDLRAVARRKRVGGVIRGTVLRGGEDVRVTYALVNAATGRTLLSNSTTRPPAELFGLEDAIAGDLLTTLGHTSPQRQRSAATASLSPDDQRRFVEAVGLLQHVKDEQSVNRAITTLESLLGNARESGAVNALLARGLMYKSSLERRPALMEQATVYARRGVTLAANDAEAHVTLGDLHNASAQHADALASYERALKLRPGHPKAVLGTAVAYANLGRNADAESMFRRALTLRPDDGTTFMRFGAFLYRRGRHEEAVAHYRRATELMPDLPQAFSNLGAALQALGRYDEALAAVERSIAIRPTAPAYSNLGTLQFYLGRYDAAERSYARATEIAPGDFVLWANLGDARRWSTASRDRAKDAYARAIDITREVLGTKPKDAYTRATMALCLAQSGNTAEAQSEIRRALEIDPTQPVVLYKAGVIALLRGNSDSAVSWIERAVKNGYPTADIRHDPQLAAIRDLPSFRSAVESSP